MATKWSDGVFSWCQIIGNLFAFRVFLLLLKLVLSFLIFSWSVQVKSLRLAFCHLAKLGKNTLTSRNSSRFRSVKPCLSVLQYYRRKLYSANLRCTYPLVHPTHQKRKTWRTILDFSHSRCECRRLKIRSKQSEYFAVSLGASLLYSFSVGHVPAKFKYEHSDLCVQQRSRLHRFQTAASGQTTSRSRCDKQDVSNADQKS